MHTEKEQDTETRPTIDPIPRTPSNLAMVTLFRSLLMLRPHHIEH